MFPWNSLPPFRRGILPKKRVPLTKKQIVPGYDTFLWEWNFATRLKTWKDKIALLYSPLFAKTEHVIGERVIGCGLFLNIITCGKIKQSWEHETVRIPIKKKYIWAVVLCNHCVRVFYITSKCNTFIFWFWWSQYWNICISCWSIIDVNANTG